MENIDSMWIDELHRLVVLAKQKAFDDEISRIENDVTSCAHSTVQQYLHAQEASLLETLRDAAIERDIQEKKLRQKKEEVLSLLAAERKKKEEAALQPTHQREHDTPPPSLTTDIVADLYKKILSDTWRDGVVTQQEISVLKKVRTKLNISDEAHHNLEREVKLNSYLAALRSTRQEQCSAQIDTRTIDGLRKKFGVSIEEHLMLETKFFQNTKQGARHEGIILIIDDKAVLLEVMNDILTTAGFRVITALTPEDALLELHSIAPDLIICDIRFENSDVDGFFIYEQVRKMTSLFAVPFIFLTGVHNEQIHKAGIELGADDFLLKPFDPEGLLSVIEGKLRRYRELKKQVGMITARQSLDAGMPSLSRA